MLLENEKDMEQQQDKLVSKDATVLFNNFIDHPSLPL